MGCRVGVDIGGTFTDFCVFDEDSGALHTLKVLSTPERPGEEVLAGLREIERRHGVTADQISYFTHGTTVGVNTVIQRKGINLCLFATEKFEDVLEVARLKMPDPYDLFSRRPVPLVTREKVFSIPGRMLFDGSEDMPLDEDAVRAAIAGVRAVDGEGIVVSLLHSYRNPDHERRVVEIVEREAPDLFVVSSHQVWPIIREYERTVTATVAGYVQPRVGYYLTSLQGALMDAGVTAVPMITKSNGGIMTAEAGKTRCAQMLLSGTASGVIGACQVARMADVDNALSLDVGGTSADVAVVRAGEPQYGVGEMIGEFPIHIPTVSVTSIGEGGGSIAWVDPHGVLKVGPESAGSNPGPACYGQGGERPTITDAFVVSGFLGAMGLGYGEVTMREDLARAAVGELAAVLSMSIEDTAEAIIKIAVSGMYLEVSKMVSRYGIDPRDMSLVAFGGAGPMLACHVARELNMRRIVVPLTPGVLSAFGGLIADIKNDFIQTVYLDLDDKTAAPIRDGFTAMSVEAMTWLREEQGYTGEATLLYSADMRYRGQSFEIDTMLRLSDIEDGDVAALAAAFHAEHERLYEHADAEAPIQVINLRLVVVGEPPKPELLPLAEATGEPEALHGIDIYADGGWHGAAIYRRDALRAGHRFQGPAVIAQDDCTTCVLGGFTVQVDTYGNLILEAED
ncbi:MAG: hydantoinase/oxoprolinase family protein [Rhodospirillaceae bacterium]|nr:hydantoinase/oxoprolinase family protein [Rhodospirillaceae bacterium]